MRIKKKREFKLSELIEIFWSQNFKCIKNNMIMHCNPLYCYNIVFIQHLLILYDKVINICNKHDIKIHWYKLINNRDITMILNRYEHILDKHKLIYKNIRNNVFERICNDHNCQYNTRHCRDDYDVKNEARINILDDIHYNLIHYNNNINNNNNNSIKYSKFATDVNDNMTEHDQGTSWDYYGHEPEISSWILKINYKHGSLKQEMLCNRFERLLWTQWNEFYDNACKLSRMNGIQQYKANNDSIPTYQTNIYKGSLITIPHILAITLYTNTNILCYKFRKTFRTYDDNGTKKSTESMIDDHSEFAHWGKLLCECVYVYGKNINFIQEYYHGLTKQFLFNQGFYCVDMPISTSTDINTANNFMGSNGGMIITFRNAFHSDSGDDKCLTVKLLSRFKHEEEILFYRSSFIITNIYIDSVFNSDINTLCKPYALLTCIFVAGYFNKYRMINDDEDDGILSLAIQHDLIHFLQYIINNRIQEKNKYFKYYKLCLKQRLMTAPMIMINRECILNNINRFDTNLLKILFDFVNINELKPGMIVQKIYDNLLKKNNVLGYSVTCEPIKLSVNLYKLGTSMHVIPLRYIVQTKCNQHIRILLIILFYQRDNKIFFQCSIKDLIYSTSNVGKLEISHAVIVFGLKCSDLNCYMDGAIAGKINSRNCRFLVKCEAVNNELYQFLFSVALISINDAHFQTLLGDYKYGNGVYKYVKLVEKETHCLLHGWGKGANSHGFTTRQFF